LGLGWKVIVNNNSSNTTKLSDGDRQGAGAIFQVDQRGIHIRKEGQHAMNREEGSYQLSHAYDRFLDMASFSRVKNRKN